MDNSIYAWVLESLRRYPLRSASLVGLSILTSLADGISISLLIPFLATLFGSVSFAAIDNGRLASFLDWISRLAGEGNELVVLTLAIVAIVSFRAVLSFIQGMVESDMSARLSHAVRTKVHANLLAVEFEYICVNDNGKLLNTLESDTWRTTEAMTSVIGMFTNVCMIVVFATILLIISWELTPMVAILLAARSRCSFAFSTPEQKVASRVLVRASESSLAMPSSFSMPCG